MQSMSKYEQFDSKFVGLYGEGGGGVANFTRSLR